MTSIETINKEIALQTSKPEVAQQLLTTTFKGLQPAVMRQAMFEGMTRGFTFENFLQKDVYAIPFSGGYSLVTSIDYARKLGMRSGVVGVTSPVYEMDGTKVISCEITVKKQTGGIVGEFTAKVYFNEYSTGKNLWTSKPRTMIAKVAEMHALRKACPEEASQIYVEEEMIKEIKNASVVIDVNPYKEKLEAVKSLEELKTVWSSLPIEAKTSLEGLKNTLKAKYENK